MSNIVGVASNSPNTIWSSIMSVGKMSNFPVLRINYISALEEADPRGIFINKMCPNIIRWISIENISLRAPFNTNFPAKTRKMEV